MKILNNSTIIANDDLFIAFRRNKVDDLHLNSIQTLFYNNLPSNSPLAIQFDHTDTVYIISKTLFKDLSNLQNYSLLIMID